MPSHTAMIFTTTTGFPHAHRTWDWTLHTYYRRLEDQLADCEDCELVMVALDPLAVQVDKAVVTLCTSTKQLRLLLHVNCDYPDATLRALMELHQPLVRLCVWSNANPDLVHALISRSSPIAVLRIRVKTDVTAAHLVDYLRRYPAKPRVCVIWCVVDQPPPDFETLANADLVSELLVVEAAYGANTEGALVARDVRVSLRQRHRKCLLHVRYASESQAQCLHREIAHIMPALPSFLNISLSSTMPLFYDDVVAWYNKTMAKLLVVAQLLASTSEPRPTNPVDMLRLGDGSILAEACGFAVDLALFQRVCRFFAREEMDAKVLRDLHWGIVMQCA